jgi:hypothetical protein
MGLLNVYNSMSSMKADGWKKDSSAAPHETNWGGVAAGGLGMLAGMIGGSHSSNYSEKDFDFDPNRTAEKRFNELTDVNSETNKGLFGRYMRLAGNSTPGKDTLMAPVRSAGGGYMGSAAIAMQKANELSSKGRNDAFEGWTNAVVSNEGNASRYLGLEYERAQKQNEGYMGYQQRQEANSQDMWGEVANLGGSLLGMFL